MLSLTSLDRYSESRPLQAAPNYKYRYPYVSGMLGSLQSLIAVIGSIGTFTGLGMSYYFHQQRQETQQSLQETQEKLQQEMQKRKEITWEELPKESKTLHEDIVHAFDPDIIVTPGLRGGTILNLMYGVKENRLVYVGIREDTRGPARLPSPPEHYIELNTTSKYCHYVPDGLAAEASDKNVLIVDDFVQTGESMRKFKEQIVELGFAADNVRTAALVCSKAAQDGGKEPDFYARTMPSEFQFPWGKAV